MTSTAIVAYLALFATVGFLFILASLLLGRLVRACAPTPEKLEIYECGEPAVGPGSVQFDLRFYVVALVFLIFEVEVAMFFPTATVFGKARQLRDPSCPAMNVVNYPAPDDSTAIVSCVKLAPQVADVYREFGLAKQSLIKTKDNAETTAETVQRHGDTLALASMIDLGIFFAVLLVGFAYVWRRGDLDWVRAVRHPATPAEIAAMALKLRSNR